MDWDKEKESQTENVCGGENTLIWQSLVLGEELVPFSAKPNYVPMVGS